MYLPLIPTCLTFILSLGPASGRFDCPLLVIFSSPATFHTVIPSPRNFGLPTGQSPGITQNKKKNTFFLAFSFYYFFYFCFVACLSGHAHGVAQFLRTLCVPRRDPSALSLFTPGPPLPAPGCRPGAAHSTPQGGLAALDPPRRLGTPPSRTASSSSSTARRPHGLGGARRARRGVHTRCTPGCRSPSRRGGGLPATPRRSTGPSAASFQIRMDRLKDYRNHSPDGPQSRPLNPRVCDRHSPRA